MAADGARSRRVFPPDLGAGSAALVLLGCLGGVAWVVRALPPGGPSAPVCFLILLGPALLLTAGAVERAHRASLAPRPGLGLFEWGGLALCLAILAFYLVIGFDVSGSHSPDAAYYFGVAKHMATTGNFEEPIVWHFLSPPDAIVHPPFDYWAGLTSILLVPVLTLFGTSQQVAGVTFALVSGCSVVAFWYLVCRAVPIHNAAVQLVTLIAFALCPAVEYYRFDTETVPLTQLFAIVALIAFARKRVLLATLLAFLVFLTRGDGIVVTGLLWLGIAAHAAMQPAVQRRRLLVQVLSLMAGLVGAYVAHHLVVFGTPTPPGSSAAPLLEELALLIAYGDRPALSGEALLALLSPGRIRAALSALARTLLYGQLVPVPVLWIPVCALALLRWWRQRGDLVIPTASLLVSLGAFLLPLSALAVHTADLAAGAPSRGLLTLVPVLLLVGGLGFDELIRWLERTPMLDRIPVPRSVLAGALALGLVWIVAGNARIYGWERLQRPDAGFHALANRLDGEPVATDLPFWIIAYTDSPAVSIPINGEQAIAAVFDRYEPVWLVLGPEPWPRMFWQGAENDALVRSVYRRTRDRIGRHSLRFVSQQDGLRLFRIESPGKSPP